eukprot:jgi/Mesvir1/2830/Mv13922-RA.1
MDGTIQSDGDQTKKRAAPLPADYPDKLKRLLDHPLLADVSREPTMDEIDTLIAVETGSALVVTVRKLDGTTLEVPVRHTATVHDLIVAVQKAVQRRTLASHGRRYISWCALLVHSGACGGASACLTEGRRCWTRTQRWRRTASLPAAARWTSYIT